MIPQIINIDKFIMQFLGGPQEWIFIILIIVLLIWGPTQLPKLARALGLAKKEFQKAQEGIEEEEEDELIKLAKELGIDTKGKSREEIRKEILEKTKK
jgi:sec-independent protein translocase protein TatA